MSESPMTAKRFRQVAAAIEQQVGRVIVGQRALVRHALITLLAGGNALLEGVPGLGKTMLVRTLADAVDNPLEMEGTYPLPEAQLDRFFFKIDVPFPKVDELVEIANRTTGAFIPQAEPAADGVTILTMQALARGVPIAGHVTAYVARLLKATHPDDTGAPEAVRRYVRYGASPRGVQAMILAGKIVALLEGRYNVAFDDIRQAALPALRHRLILNFEAQAEGVTTDAVIEATLEEVVADES